MTDIIPIADREQWMALRSKDVTASAIGAVFGVHEYVSPLQLHLLKSGQVIEDSEESPPMKRGRLLEPVALQLLQEKHPEMKLLPGANEFYYRDAKHRIGATPDSIWEHPTLGKGVIQIKTVEPFIFKMKWLDDDGLIDPPVWISMQGFMEANLVEGVKWAAVAPMRVGHGVDIDLIPIPLDIDLMPEIHRRVAEFWKNVEDGNPPPADYAVDGDLLKRLYAKEGGSPIDLSQHNRIAELCEQLEAWNKRKTRSEGAAEVLKAEIVEILGDAPAAIHPDWNITRKTVKAKPYTVEAREYRNLRITRKKKKADEGEES